MKKMQKTLPRIILSTALVLGGCARSPDYEFTNEKREKIQYIEYDAEGSYQFIVDAPNGNTIKYYFRMYCLLLIVIGK